MQFNAKQILVGGMISAFSISSPAAFFNGNDLYGRLGDAKSGNPQDYIGASGALGYITGISDAMSGKIDSQTGAKFCTPQNATRGQLADVVFAYLNSHSEERHLSGWSLVEAALSNAFPCR